MNICIYYVPNLSKEKSIDGFNSYFFKQAWPIVKQGVYEAVLEFFADCDAGIGVP